MTIFASILWFGPLVNAQGNLGSIAGTTLDPSGAAVPDVQMTLVDLRRGVHYSATPTESGAYRFGNLTPGVYRLEAGKQGFKKFVADAITVLTGSTTAVTVRMEVGDVTESVTVSGQIGLLNTTSAEISTPLTEKLYLDLPLSITSRSVSGTGRRQIEQFLSLTPGTGAADPDNLWGKRFNGAPSLMNEVLIDGGAASGPINGGVIETNAPPYESMEEFKVQTVIPAPEYGNGMAVQNFTMRSGTNEYHAKAYEFLRNDALDSRNFFKGLKAKQRMNEFGFAGGGPLIIPKVYNGRNRTFFYGVFEHYIFKGAAPTSPTYTVPTPEMKRGDFSTLLRPDVGPIPVYDPSTAAIDPATGRQTRQAFAGNVIPESRIVPQARFWLPYIAAPNRPGIVFFQNYAANTEGPKDEKNWSVKGDHNLNDRQRFSFSYWWMRSSNTGSEDTGQVYNGKAPQSVNVRRGGGIRARHTWTIGPRVINEGIFAYTKLGQASTCGPNGEDLGGVSNPMGIPNLEQYWPRGSPTFRTIGPGHNYWRSGGALFGCQRWGEGINRGQSQWMYQFGDNLSYLRGKHTFKFGFDARRDYILDRFASSGFITFSSTQTSLNLAPRTGDPFASMLLGLADRVELNGPQNKVGYLRTAVALYGQDEWKITPKLTMNYGVRYNIPRPTVEEDDLLSGFDPGLPNPGAGGRPGALLFLGKGPGRNGQRSFPGVKGNRFQFAPRVGFAYSLDPRTVLRVGYGITFAFGNSTAMGGNVGGEPFQVGLAGLGVNLFSPDNGLSPAASLATGLPRETRRLPITDPTQLLNAGINYWDPNSGTEPYMGQWTFSIQRQLPSKFFLDMAYVGQKGTRLPANLDNINQLPTSVLSLGSLLTQPFDSPAAAAAGIRAPYAGFRGTVGQALRPFPQYLDVTTRFASAGMSKYHALQAKLNRTAGPLHLLTSYTLSKNLSNIGGSGFGSGASVDIANLELEKAIEPGDALHLLTMAWVYELPVGRGKKFASGISRPADLVLGGWQVSGSQRYQSGRIVAISGGNIVPIFNRAVRPDRVAGTPARVASCADVKVGGSLHLNPAAFRNNDRFSIPTASRTIPDFRGCGYYTEDFSVVKRFMLTEKLNLQLRSEFYNIFNRHKFANPSSNTNSPGDFGKILNVDAAVQPRTIQFAVKVEF
jgi:hypothetical protein